MDVGDSSNVHVSNTTYLNDNRVNESELINNDNSAVSVEPMDVDNIPVSVEPMQIDNTDPILQETFIQWASRLRIARNLTNRNRYRRLLASALGIREQQLELQRQRLLQRRQAINDEERAERLRERQIIIEQQRENEDNATRANRQAVDRASHHDRQRRCRVVAHATPTPVEPFLLGSMNVACTSCKALHFEREKIKKLTTFNSCCRHGKVNFDVKQQFPEKLQKLFMRTDTEWKQFHKNILKFNKLLSFAMMEDNNSRTRLPGIFNYRIQGQVQYSLDRYIEALPNREPCRGQLWIVDTSDINDLRFNGILQDNDEAMFVELYNMLKANNKYVEIYQMLYDTEKSEREQAEAEGCEPRSFHIMFKKRTENASNPAALPQAGSNEVAAIYVSDDNGVIPFNDIRVQLRRHDNQTPMSKFIDRHSEHIEPLTFTLLNPSGEGDFWFMQKPQDANNGNSKNLTPLQYFMYKLFDRRQSGPGFNAVLYGGKLLSQYLIHAWTVVEHNRMEYIRHNQKQLRVETYAGVQDFVKNYANNNNVDIGRVVVLPSSYSQSPRCLAQRFHDAMCTVRKYGKPHLFITMTCNPDHPDIVNNLHANEKPTDRPDLVCKVFNEQVKEFVKRMNDGLFGIVKHYIYVVEFQKRGLPHIHSLWTFEENNWNDVDKIDAFVSAELPDPSTDNDGYNLVTKFMLHKPCGQFNPDSMCMEKGCCKRGFPKSFVEETKVDENAYPMYRRRDTGITTITKVRGRQFVVDNRNVVPHNITLLKMFQCHINVEIVCSLNVVTYLYKYLFKGPDKIDIEICNNNADYDEIKSYLDARYLGAQESYWRLTEFDMHYNNDSIERLDVHLPKEQMISMNTDASITDVLSAMLSNSKLLAFFDLNKNEPNGLSKRLTYIQLCQHYTWITKTRKWSMRRNTPKPKCPRMYAVDPKKTELFYLRKLLTIIKGPTCFEDLRRDAVDVSLLHPTFRAACVARGLVVDDTMYIDTMIEGVRHNMPKQLRGLFARMVAHCDVEEPLIIWNMFRREMCADLMRYNHLILDDAEIIGFKIVLRNIIANDRLISEFPTLQMALDAIGGDLEDIPFNVLAHQRRAEEMENQYNTEQRNAYDSIVQSIANPTNNTNCFFVNGPGGSGKTFLFNGLFSKLMGSGKNVIIMAWSGIAASLYETGRTCHNVFKLDFPFREDSNSGVTMNSKLGKDLLDVDLIIWDEAPMAPRRALEVVDAKLREITHNDVPFGGKVIVLGGDFCQLPPVVRNGTKFDILRNSIKSSSLWDTQFAKNTFKLSRNQRANDANAFAEEILRIGNGDANDENGQIKLPQQCITEDDLVETVFADVINDSKVVSTRAILCTLNKQVDEYNEKIMNLLDATTEKLYVARDRVEESNSENVYSPEYFETFRPTGFPAYNMRLRKNAIVMLMRNLSISEGLCNGTRLRIIELKNNLIIAKKLNKTTGNDADDEDDNVVMIPRITLCDESTVFTLYRNQFPLRPAFAITINKSQGQTFEQVGIDISNRIFSHGHLYVALSRTRSWNCIKMHVPEVADDTTDNIVYSELLLESMPELQDNTLLSLNPDWTIVNDAEMQNDTCNNDSD